MLAQGHEERGAGIPTVLEVTGIGKVAIRTQRQRASIGIGKLAKGDTGEAVAIGEPDAESAVGQLRLESAVNLLPREAEVLFPVDPRPRW